ncbi:MAG: DUF2225 domain-containing protein [Defluviitaleaceae bacterium]|nr:DUF2225 domain-containing protein [Defluviitaleaceae bacterium]MCL2239970.1 DUF2225 domain-containing protein [Defluviitaleaceae bacterium]
MNANVDLMKVLSDSATTMRFAQGNAITTEGDGMGDEMFFLLSGKVGVYRNYKKANEVKIAELNPGDFFGEMTLFLNRPRTSTTVAETEPVIVLAVNRSNAYEFLQHQPQVTFAMLKALCERLEKITDLKVSTFTAGKPAAVAAAPVAAPASAAPVSATPAQPAAAPKKEAAPVTATALDTNTDLFPQGHKKYSLQIPATSDEMIYEKKFECPLCAKNFTTYGARDTRLKVIEREKDFRTRHEGIDITHYELVTCTHCYFSNFDTSMKTAIASRFYPNTSKITAYGKGLGLTFAKERNINEIFAGYYLALKGADLFYTHSHLLVAKAWLRLMWLYKDCEDTQMEDYALERAHKAYISVFENTEVNPNAAQQISIIVGELSLRVNDLSSAKTYFTKARMHRSGGQVMIKMAEDGIDEIRRREAGE